MTDAPSPAGPDKPEMPPPAVSSLRAESAIPMQRSMTDNMREERDHLREIAEQTLNVIVDLNLDGTIKWVSPSWVEVIGTQPESVQGQPLSDIIVSDNKGVFPEVVESMKKDDTRSHRVRFAVALGPLSKLLSFDGAKDGADPAAPQVMDLEAQGIMVYDGASGGESHVSRPPDNRESFALLIYSTRQTMWMIRPWTAPREVQIDLPALIVDSLDSGAEVLAG
ncbi:PAS domain S-box protein, partial [Candidatus Bathyarchaeota archaeon]|nr:PAS domain S-box protein [Candidatus Bathyarchaeota archaeon]